LLFDQTNDYFSFLKKLNYFFEIKIFKFFELDYSFNVKSFVSVYLKILTITASAA